MVSWVDDLLILGCKQDVDQAKKGIFSAFECKAEGVLTEYVGNIQIRY